MKTHPLHILMEDGKAYCIGRKPAGMGEIACPKCAQAYAEEQALARRKAEREQRKIQRAADLESGILSKKANGYWALRYTLENKEVEDSLKELSEERAKTLAPLCMKYIRRTGKRLGDITKCVADYQ